MSDMNLAKDAKDTKDTEDVKDTNDKNGAADVKIVTPAEKTANGSNAVMSDVEAPVDTRFDVPDDTPYEELQLTNEFMFAKVMGNDPELHQ